MSSPERTKPIRRGTALLLAGLALALAAGCTVRPLYQAEPTTDSSLAPSRAGAQIAVAPVTTRYGQEVRNHLIFLLYGGGKSAEAPRYRLDMTVTRSDTAAAVIQAAQEGEPTAGIITLLALYKLTDNDTGSVVASGRRSFAASYDRPRQEFALIRARINAEDRAARELAEVLNLVLIQDVQKR